MVGSTFSIEDKPDNEMAQREGHDDDRHQINLLSAHQRPTNCVKGLAELHRRRRDTILHIFI